MEGFRIVEGADKIMIFENVMAMLGKGCPNENDFAADVEAIVACASGDGKEILIKAAEKILEGKLG